MAPTQPRARVGGNGELRSALAVGLSLGLSMGFLDIAWNLSRKGPPAFRSFETLLSPLAATTLAVLLLFGVTYLVGRGGLARTRFHEPLPFLVSLTLFWGSIFTLGTLNHLLTTDYHWSRAVTAVTVASFSLILAANGYMLFRPPSQGPLGRGGAKVAVVACPLILAGWVLGSWLYYYGGRPEARKAMFVAWIGIGLVSVALGRFLLQRKGRLSPLRWMLSVFLVVLVGPVLPLLTVNSPSAGSHHSVRRVILITVDTLRADAVSYADERGVPTRNLDALARDSVIFQRAISAAPWTLPAIGTILTGLSPAVHGAVGPFDFLPTQLPTLAERLGKEGFRTAAIGHNPFLSPRFLLSQGFQDYDISPRLHLAGTFGSRLLGRLAPLHFKETANTQELTELALEWLRGHSEEDLFLWLHYFDPHDPYHPPERYRPEGEPPPGLGWDFSKAQDIRSGNYVPSPPQKAWAKSLYEAEIRYVDDNLGRVIQELKHLDIYDEALIVFASDHGEEFWEHGGYEHGHAVYDEVIHVPWLVKLPGGSLRQEVWETVSTGCITPVVLDQLGIDYEPPSLSYSIPTALKAGNPSRPVNYPSSRGLLYYEDREAIYLDQWKYIRWRVSGREELYDLETDPAETHSVADTSESILARARRISAELEQSARELREHYGVPPRDPDRAPKSRREELNSLGYIQ